MQGLTIAEARLFEGAQWVEHWDLKCTKLSEARTFLPNVQLQVSPRAELLKMAIDLVKSPDVFWPHFGRWVSTRVNAYTEIGRDGLRIVRTLLPDIENGGASFYEITAAIRRSDYSMLVCYVPANPLNPEGHPPAQSSLAGN